MLDALESLLRRWSWLSHAEFSDARLWLILLAALLVSWGLLRLLRGKKSRSKAGRAIAYGLLIGVVTLSYALLLGQWRGYPELVADREILELHFHALGDAGRFQVELKPVTVPGNKKRSRVPSGSWEVQGEHWRLTARRFSAAGWLDFPPRYRLYRLVTRPDKPTEQNPQRAYLIRLRPQPDLWRLIKNNPAWFPLFQARTISSDFLRIEDGASYRIALGEQGITVRRLTSDDLTGR